MKNPKTTFTGIAAVLGGLASIFSGDYVSGITAIVTGIGLIFAKDYNVTGLPPGKQ